MHYLIDKVPKIYSFLFSLSKFRKSVDTISRHSSTLNPVAVDSRDRGYCFKDLSVAIFSRWCVNLVHFWVLTLETSP